MKCRYIWIGVIGSLVLAVLLGVAFHFIESDYEDDVAVKTYRQLTQFLANKTCVNLTSIKYLSLALAKAPTGGVRVGVDKETPIENLTNWNFQSTIFLTLEILGSLGYGNTEPKTTGGRVFCAFFALFGIPLFIVAATGVSERLTQLAERIRRVLCRIVLRTEPVCKSCTKHHLICALILFVLDLVFFVFIPAAIFTAIETWNYAEALYCCFITVLTIGFGDFVPGARSSAGFQPRYRLAVGFWILIALFWFSGVIGALNDALNYYTEINEPFKLDGNGSQDQIHVKKNWKEQFDKQWNKLRHNSLTRQPQQQQRRPTTTTTRSPAVNVQQATQVDVIQVRSVPVGSQLYPSIVDDHANHVTCIVPNSAVYNSQQSSLDCVSRVPINN
jgi:hypothetical protein